jgi:hypothetical protein
MPQDHNFFTVVGQKEKDDANYKKRQGQRSHSL